MLMQKRELRQHFLQLRRSLSPAERSAASAAIVQKIRSLAVYRQSKWIGLYAAMDDEADLSALIAPDGAKHFAFPRYDGGTQTYAMVEIRDPAKDLCIGRYGIAEPRMDLPELDSGVRKKELLFLVPAVSCDPAGHRLGRGGGFYDRLLADSKQPKIAVIFDCQLSTETDLPAEAHDVTMDCVVTENRLITRRKSCIC